MPTGDAGLIAIPQCNFSGKSSKETESAPQYSISARLTQHKLPLLLVDLPGQMSAYMLGRIIHYQGQPYRLDLFGGSKMKMDVQSLSDILTEAQGERSGQKAPRRHYGKLFAVPLAETTQDSDFTRFIAKLFPYKESFYYFQRMLMASAPGMINTPQGHVLEGNFSVGILPDRAAGEMHPFRFSTARGPD